MNRVCHNYTADQPNVYKFAYMVSDSYQANVIETFNSPSIYLVDLFNIDKKEKMPQSQFNPCYNEEDTKRILGECLFISSLPGKVLRTLVDIARLAERFDKRSQKPSMVNVISIGLPIVSLFKLTILT